MNKLNGHTEKRVTTKQKGDAAEDRALQHLQAKGLQLVQRNYRTPGRGGGEIDLVMQDADYAGVCGSPKTPCTEVP